MTDLEIEQKQRIDDLEATLIRIMGWYDSGAQYWPGGGRKSWKEYAFEMWKEAHAGLSQDKG